MAVYKLNEIAPIQQGTLSENDKYWLLNLDMVESNSGKVLGYNYVSSDQIGASTIAFDTNNVLYSKLRPYLNKVVLPTQNGYATSEMVPLRPNTNIITREYLTYLLRSPLFVTYINSKTSGAKMPRAKLDALKNYEIDCPPIVDQVARTTRLDEIVTAAEICREQIEKYDLLIKARFVEMFGDPVSNEKGWVTRPLLSMGSCKNGMNFHYDDSGVEINCLGVGDFKDYSIIDDTATLPTVSLNEMPSSEYLLRDDDIVFVRSNGNKKMVGRSVAVYPGTVPTTFSGFCIRYRREDDSVITPYLLRVLKAESMRQKMYGRGANIQNLNQQTLSSLDIPVPPSVMQEQFAIFVAQVDKSKAVVQSIMDKLNTLQVSLMQEYFG